MYPMKHEKNKTKPRYIISLLNLFALLFTLMSIFRSIIILFVESNIFAPYGKHTGFCKPLNVSIVQRSSILGKVV